MNPTVKSQFFFIFTPLTPEIANQISHTTTARFSLQYITATMPHFPEPFLPEDLRSPNVHLPEPTSSSEDPVHSTSTAPDGGKFGLPGMATSNNGREVITRLPPSEYLVKFQNAESTAGPDITYKFSPFYEGDTEPPSHGRAMRDFVEGLALLHSHDTAGDHTALKPSVASYIEDEDESLHPWARVTRWDGKKENGTVQMCLTVQDPLTMEKRSVDADPPLSVQDGGV